MKRLPALMLSVFMLTLLSLPVSAGSQNMIVSGYHDIPVDLTIDDSNMIDVTIEWDMLLKYTYDGTGFTPAGKTMPKITVTNNTDQKDITLGLSFIPSQSFRFSPSEFDLGFYADAAAKPGKDSSITTATVSSKSSASFYAIPSGTPVVPNGDLSDGGDKKVGSVRITIGLPTS